jgi:uncharacterized protein (TIGR03083 family)
MLEKEAADLLEETEVLAEAVSGLSADALQTVTQFKGWTIEDVLIHLHFWNGMVDLSLTDPEAFEAQASDIAGVVKTAGFRDLENAHVAQRGPALVDAWRGGVQAMVPRWVNLEPKQRLPWM